MTRISNILLISALIFGHVASAQTVTETASPPAQIAVSPSKFEVVIGPKPAVESLRVFNMSSDPVTVLVNVATWDLDEDSRVRIVEPTEQSLDQWLVINPLQFTVGGGESQAVRFSIRPRVQPDPGEHRAMIYLTQQPQEDTSAPVTVRFRLGVAIYGYVGDIRRVGTLHGVTIGEGSNPISAAFDIASDGNAHIRLRGQYAVWPAATYPGWERTDEIPKLELPKTVVSEPIVDAGFLPTTPVLAGTRREIVLHIGKTLPPGNYVLDLNGRLGDTSVDRGLPFTVAPVPPAANPLSDAPKAVVEKSPE
jgi:hypothetical protein